MMVQMAYEPHAAMGAVPATRGGPCSWATFSGNVRRTYSSGAVSRSMRCGSLPDLSWPEGVVEALTQPCSGSKRRRRLVGRRNFATWPRCSSASRTSRRGWSTTQADLATLVPVLGEPSEAALLKEMLQRWPEITAALMNGQLVEAMHELARLHAPVDKFFADVLVMSDNPVGSRGEAAASDATPERRLTNFGDISEIVPEEAKTLASAAGD